MFPYIPLILGGISAATGASELIWGGKESDDDEKWKAWLEQRMKYGDPQALSVLTGALSPGILRDQYAKQNNLARMHAARGTSYSTQADADITSVPGPGEVLAPILAQEDMRIRSRAEENYFTLRESIRKRREASQKAGWGMIGQGLWMGASGFMPKTPDPFSNQFSNQWSGMGQYDQPFTGQGQQIEGYDTNFQPPVGYDPFRYA